MGRMGNFNIDGLKQFRDELNKLQNPDDFVESCAKELAASLLGMVVKRTPIGQYPKSSGKKGGTLKRGWSMGEIRKEGSVFKIYIINPTEYASYVEYGHRTIKKNGYGWADGKKMMTISEQELEKIAPKVLENKIKKYLGGLMK